MKKTIEATDKKIEAEGKKETWIELGNLLGKREAFSAVAGRCSAAQAELIRRIKEEHLYRDAAANWEEFCTTHLKMSRRNADRIVAWEKELGALFFITAQLTGMNADEFRAIAPAVSSDGIHVDGKVIALIPENAAQLAEAVLRLQQQDSTEPKPAPDVTAQVSALEKRGRQLADAFRRVTSDRSDVIGRQWARSAVRDLCQLLARVELEL
jgi:hypothetical protein